MKVTQVIYTGNFFQDSDEGINKVNVLEKYRSEVESLLIKTYPDVKFEVDAQNSTGALPSIPIIIEGIDDSELHDDLISAVKDISKIVYDKGSIWNA